MEALKKTFHIRGLDGLRFLGSFVVLFHHVNRGKVLFGYSAGLAFTKGLGHTSMTLFFTLSGFLISYLLLAEKKNTGTISLPKFYKRRITRIWPLYYLLVFSSLLFFENYHLFSLPGPKEPVNYGLSIPLYILQMPNFHLFFTAVLLAAIGHLWTIGVEEQFYAISPVIIKKTKSIVKAFVIIIVVKVTVKVILVCAIRFAPLTADQLLNMKHLQRFLFDLRFEAFAIGGIAAHVFLEQKEKILNFVNTPFIKYSNLVFLFATMLFGNRSELLHILYAISFCIIILNLATKSTPVFFLDNKYIRYIGQISYGIYMYQLPVIYVVANAMRPYYIKGHLFVWNIVYYSACFILPVLIAIVSYEFMEKRIMALARK